MKRVIAGIAVAGCAMMLMFTPGTGKAAEAGMDGKQAIVHLGTVMQNYLASVRAEAVQTKSPAPEKITSGPASSWMKKVAANEVNMVTNKHMKKAQAEVKLDGKTYFASGPGMEANLAKNASTKFAKDPFTGKTVDKSEAAIFADASGNVWYFESENSYKGFIALASPETLFGYSEPK